MSSAGFYAIHTSKLRFARDGRWYADDEPVTHQRLARVFSRYLRRKASGGYEISIDERFRADVQVDDTPYVVVSVNVEPDGAFSIDLSDGSTEPLAGDSLQVGAGNVLYCAVKGGTDRARFLRPAYYELTKYIEETGPGRFQLRCGNATHPIRRC